MIMNLNMGQDLSLKLAAQLNPEKNLYEGSNQLENNKHVHITHSAYVLYVLATGTVSLSCHWLCTINNLSLRPSR